MSPLGQTMGHNLNFYCFSLKIQLPRQPPCALSVLRFQLFWAQGLIPTSHVPTEDFISLPMRLDSKDPEEPTGYILCPPCPKMPTWMARGRLRRPPTCSSNTLWLWLRGQPLLSCELVKSRSAHVFWGRGGDVRKCRLLL